MQHAYVWHIIEILHFVTNNNFECITEICEHYFFYSVFVIVWHMENTIFSAIRSEHKRYLYIFATKNDLISQKNSRPFNMYYKRQNCKEHKTKWVDGKDNSSGR